MAAATIAVTVFVGVQCSCSRTTSAIVRYTRKITPWIGPIVDTSTGASNTRFATAAARSVRYEMASTQATSRNQRTADITLPLEIRARPTTGRGERVRDVRA